MNHNTILNEDDFRERRARTRPVFAEFRMSRFRQPRATMFAMILLAVVFLLFGVFASAVEPVHVPAPNTVEGAAHILSQWAFGA